MKQKISILIGGLLVALMIVGVVGATNVFAQSSALIAPEHGGGRGGGGRGFGLVEIQAAAEALNMTTDELITALRSGKTLETIATEAGVELQAVQDAISAARQEELRTRIEQGVADGTITQEKADWLLEGLEKGFLDGPGFGFGPRGPKLDQTPVVTPTPPTSG